MIGFAPPYFETDPTPRQDKEPVIIFAMGVSGRLLVNFLISVVEK